MAATRANTPVPGPGPSGTNGRTRHSTAPCGACRALVPADSGCEHWRPGGPADVCRRERNRKYRADAWERARQDVAAFRRAMGYPVEL